MTAQILDGTALLDAIKVDLRARVEALAEVGITPGLATVLVGEDPSSVAYVRGKHEACAEVGIVSVRRDLPATTSQEELEAVIAELNDDPSIDGFIVQLPLPDGVDEEAALRAIHPDKDVDGLHPVNLGRLVSGVRGPRPCTPLGIQALLVHHGVAIEGKEVVIVGRGLTIGRPLALLLSLKEANANAAVTVAHTGVAELAELTRRGDILVAAAGRASVVTPEMVKPGAAVVSAGITMEGRRLIPDVDESVAEVAAWITPRLGGVGPTTIAMLMRNAVEAAERQARGA